MDCSALVLFRVFRLFRGAPRTSIKTRNPGFVPVGQVKIARRFIAGVTASRAQVSKERLNPCRFSRRPRSFLLSCRSCLSWFKNSAPPNSSFIILHSSLRLPRSPLTQRRSPDLLYLSLSPAMGTRIPLKCPPFFPLSGKVRGQNQGLSLLLSGSFRAL